MVLFCFNSYHSNTTGSTFNVTIGFSGCDINFFDSARSMSISTLRLNEKGVAGNEVDILAGVVSRHSQVQLKCQKMQSNSSPFSDDRQPIEEGVERNDDEK